MDRFLFLFLIYSLFVYCLGIICSKKDFFSVDLLKKTWPDLIYFLFTAIILSWIIQSFWLKDSQNTVQMLIFSITTAALIYQGFLSRVFRNYVNRPIIKVLFDDTKSEYFHKTLMRIYTEIFVQQAASTTTIPMVDFVPTYYVRLKVVNEGNLTLENTEVIIENAEVVDDSILIRPFMPLNLHWAFAEDKERRKINIPPNDAYRIIDFFELTNPMATKVYANKLAQGNVDYDRYHALSSGFRICSVPPNTLSDIYDQGIYVFTLGIYANNSKPIYKKIRVEYDGVWNDNPDIMRKDHVKVRLLD
ncbi:MAG: hypothetical protein US54_C0065G0008 [Candidatus Roizmanbacteria bacterium GW2011_GWA2_37_7]|uniref:Uncharacterized protein n=1 Tax=Candidatus Roizmanbacteria bacterium GW2011_GWA2_37_7 TaxID=1618481 RepID=A0A0G0GZU5_9BACT|nr:MAG: hypothetical protein US54_C0065G0008 [Candidatus Roizmanbacteria bacterium GW2011_GWA2_37_7]